MPIQRMFLDWSKPVLPAAADYLIARYGGKQPVIDARRAIVVVSGSEAGRRLQMLLLERAEQSGKVFLPPTVQTESPLPEQLYRPRRPAASDLTQLFVWAEVLRAAAPRELEPIVPKPPAPEAVGRWLDLARLFQRQHDDLAKEGYGFADVAACAVVEQLPVEQRRWQAMAHFQQRYLERIDGLGFWDRQTARRVAVEKRECHSDRDIILIGTVDLLRVLREMLDQVADSSESADRVTALIHAPASLAECFDTHGCLVTKHWLEAELPIADAQIVRVGGANEQAAAVAREIAAAGDRYRADQITVGLADESLAPSIDRRLRQHGLRTRFIGARTLAQSGPVGLLTAVASYLQQRDFASFAALVRHPDLFDWLAEPFSKESPHAPANGAAEADEEGTPRRAVDLLAALDRYYNDRLPSDFDLTKVKASGRVSLICTRMLWILQPLLGGRGPIAAWIEPIQELLSKVYSRVELHNDRPADRPAILALGKLVDMLDKLQQMAPEVAPALSAAETLGLVLEQLAGVTVPPPRDPEAIEMLGWLELPQDDAPVLLVTTFNEGRVPSYVDADLFLPESIRRELALNDNDRRYARDAYAASVLLHSREQVKFLVARRNAAGDPLAPSRLLFAADRETVARRAVRIFAEESEPPLSSIPPVALPTDTRLPIPPADPLPEPLAQFSVSSFKSYLTCPYRFYLRHVLKLMELSDRSQELEANTFGSLLHDVLDDFGKHEEARLFDDPEKIFAFLSDQLDMHADRNLLSRSRGAIAVQLEQLRARLRRFADWQADRVRDQWQISYVEKKLEVAWEVDGQAVTLSGRVDRIDIHAATGEAMVFDYKSGNTAITPEKAHRRQQKWVDLQLPLYRHLVRATGLEVEPKLGYIALPKDVTKIGAVVAEWTPHDYRDADETARQVIRDVWRGKFGPASTEVDARYDIYAAICQSRSLGRPPTEIEENDS